VGRLKSHFYHRRGSYQKFILKAKNKFLLQVKSFVNSQVSGQCNSIADFEAFSVNANKVFYRPFYTPYWYYQKCIFGI